MMNTGYKKYLIDIYGIKPYVIRSEYSLLGFSVFMAQNSEDFSFNFYYNISVLFFFSISWRENFKDFKIRFVF